MSRRRHKAFGHWTRYQAARPVSPWLKADQFAARVSDAAFARPVAERDNAVGVADVKSIAEERHAKGLIHSVQESAADLSSAIGIDVTQKRGDGGLAGAPAARSGHFQGRDIALGLRKRNGRVRTEGRRLRPPLKAPPQDRRGAD